MFSSSSTTSSDTLRSPESGTEKFSLAVFCLSVAVAIGVSRRIETDRRLRGQAPGGHWRNSVRANSTGESVPCSSPKCYLRFFASLRLCVRIFRALFSFLKLNDKRTRNTMTPEQRNELITKYAAGYDEVINALDGFTADSLGAPPI